MDPHYKDGMSCNSLTHDEEKTNMAIWAMSSAPMQISVDVLAVPAASKAILLNKEIIAVDQDPLGRMVFRFSNPPSGVQAWKKNLLGGAVAVALVNMNGTGTGGASPGAGRGTGTANNADRGMSVSFEFRDVGFAPDTLVRVRDLFEQKDLGVFTGSFSAEGIPLHGVTMLRLEYEPKYRAGL
jgi:alpha-galactosidase